MKTIIDKINSLKEKFRKVKVNYLAGSEVTVTADMAKISIETLQKMKETAEALDVYVTYRPAQNTQGVVLVFIF